MQSAAFATRLDDFPINPARTGGLHPSGLPGNVIYPSLLGWHFSSSTNASSNSNVTVVNLSPTPLPYAPCAGAGVRGGGNYNSGGSGSTSTTYTTMTSPAASGSLLAWASVASKTNTKDTPPVFSFTRGPWLGCHGCRNRASTARKQCPPGVSGKLPLPCMLTYARLI